MQPNIAAIVAGATAPDEDPFYRPFLKQASYKIAADAGLNAYHRLGILPDVLIGDLDSVSEESYRWAEQNNIPVQTFPEQKDATDTQLALDIAIKMQYGEIFILGGMGKRLDHALGNLFLLYHAFQKGVSARLIDPLHHVQLLTAGFVVQIQGRPRDLVSLIPISDVVRGVSMKGFHWNLENTTVERGSTLGISNYLEQEQGSISLTQGFAFVIQSRE